MAMISASYQRPSPGYLASQIWCSFHRERLAIRQVSNSALM
jgi:hypothetical protein